MRKIAVLYSHSQQAFHIETLTEYMKSNIKEIITKSPHQYCLIAVTDNEDQASEIIISYRQIFEQ